MEPMIGRVCGVRRRGLAAFTLVELLVVVSIIAALVGILLPSLGAARDAAKSAVCLSNLRRIGMQMQNYVVEFSVYPPVRLKRVRDRAGSWTDYYHGIGHQYRRKAPRWQWFISTELGPLIDPRKYDTEAAFNSAMKIDNQYWNDPALREYNNDVRNGAYGYNGTYLGNTRDDGQDWIRFPVRERIVRAAADTIVVGDSRGGLERHGDHSYWFDPPKQAMYGDASAQPQAFGPNPSKPLEMLGHSPIEARHRGKGNAAFADGHATTSTLAAYGYQVDARGKVVPREQIDRSKANNRLWTGTGRDDLPNDHIVP